MKRDVRIVTLVVASLGVIGHLLSDRSSVTLASAHRTHAPAPIIRSSSQLAALIRRHDMRGGGAGPFKPQVTVTCRRATHGGGAYDHVCRETSLGALCIVGSTPEVDVLEVDLPACGYRTVQRRTVVAEGCSPP